MLSFLKFKDSPVPAHAVDEASSVQEARTRARRRLIGAAVLVGIGIVGFPLIFETQPRPVAADIPIVAAPRDNVPAPPPVRAAPAPAPKASTAVVAEPAAPASAASVAAAPPVRAAAEASVAAAPEVRAAPVASAPAAQDSHGRRAQALLEGRPTPPPTAPAAPEPKSGRFVVQAGAYTEAAALREARQKVEKLGLKTYTQVIETDAGARTRVRVGPFETREEAEKVAARIKGSGMAANILSL